MKILIIKPSSFGDIVQALPCANALKLSYPGCEITWVVFKGWEDLISLCSDVDKTIVWDRKKGIKGFFEVLKIIRQTEYDLIFDLQGLLRSALLAKFAKGKNKIGVSGMKEFSNILIKEAYPENAKINLLAKGFRLENIIEVRKSDSTMPPNTIIDVNPRSGTAANIFTKVVITVNSYEPPTQGYEYPYDFD